MEYHDLHMRTHSLPSVFSLLKENTVGGGEGLS